MYVEAKLRHGMLDNGVSMMSQPFDEYQFITPLARKASSVHYLAQSARETTDKVVFKIFDAIYLDSEPKQKNFLQEVDKLK